MTCSQEWEGRKTYLEGLRRKEAGARRAQRVSQVQTQLLCIAVFCFSLLLWMYYWHCNLGTAGFLSTSAQVCLLNLDIWKVIAD